VGVVSGVAFKQGTAVWSTGTSFLVQRGGIQTTTITGNITYGNSLNNGESFVLHVISGSSHTVNWPQGTTWLSSSGNYAPTLTDDDVLVFWRTGNTLFGAYAGSYA
jgi:hypothetical protein